MKLRHPWVPILTDLVMGNPKTKKLARRLALPRVWVAGHMVALWLWALEHRPSGIFEKSEGFLIYEAAEFPDVVLFLKTRYGTDGGVDKLVIADEKAVIDILLDEHWLDLVKGGKDGSRLTIHDWEVYVGLLRSVSYAREKTLQEDPGTDPTDPAPKENRSGTDDGAIHPPPPPTVTVDRNRNREGESERGAAPPSASHSEDGGEAIDIARRLQNLGAIGTWPALVQAATSWIKLFGYAPVLARLSPQITGKDIFWIAKTYFGSRDSKSSSAPKDEAVRKAQEDEKKKRRESQERELEESRRMTEIAQQHLKQLTVPEKEALRKVAEEELEENGVLKFYAHRPKDRERAIENMMLELVRRELKGATS